MERGHSGERERITDSLIKNRSVHEYYIRRGTRPRGNPGSTDLLVSASRADEMISRIFPGHINSRDPTGAPTEIIKIFTTANACARSPQ